MGGGWGGVRLTYPIIYIDFNLFKLKSRGSGPGADAISYNFTVPPTTPPLNFSTGDEVPRPLQ